MAASNSVIITCATTGGIHTPTVSEHLPNTPDRIAHASIEAAEAGVSVIHLHAGGHPGGHGRAPILLSEP